MCGCIALWGGGVYNGSMTDKAIYQLIGRAYCIGRAQGIEKAAAVNPPPMMFNAKPQFDVSKAREFNAALKARREFLQQAAIDAGRAAGSSFRSSLSTWNKGPEVTPEKPTAPEEGKGLWSKIKTGLTSFSDRMLNMSKNYDPTFDLFANQSWNDWNNTGMY